MKALIMGVMDEYEVEFDGSDGGLASLIMGLGGDAHVRCVDGRYAQVEFGKISGYYLAVYRGQEVLWTNIAPE